MSKICIFIHGYLTDYKDFQKLPSELMKEYDQIILLTLPGHSDKSLINDFTKDNVFNYINHEIKEIINNNIVDVVGFSLGGALSWYIALNYRINKLILLAPANSYFNFFLINSKIKYLQELNKLEKSKKIKLKAELKSRDNEAIKFILQNTLPKFSVKNGYHFCKIINEINKNKGTINVPMLVIRGNLDELVPKKSVDICFDRCINTYKEMYEIPDIGHMMLRTHRQEEIINKIKQFLTVE